MQSSKKHIQPGSGSGTLYESQLKGSVADPECLSWILIFVHLGFPDLVSQIQKQEQKRMKKNLLSYLFRSHKHHKIENYFIFECVK
jgi:hypothetical protein